MLEEEALDLTHYISHTGQVSLFGCVIECHTVDREYVGRGGRTNRNLGNL